MSIGQPGSGTSRAVNRAVLVGVGTVGLCAVVYGSAHPGQWLWSLPQWSPAPITLPVQPAQSDGSGLGDNLPSAQASPVWHWVFLGLGIAVLVVVLVLVGRWVYKTVRALIAAHVGRVPLSDQLEAGQSLPGQRLTPQQVVDAVDQALQRLDQAATSSDAVIQAWLALEEVAGRHGVRRRSPQTPTEFTAELLDRSDVPAPSTAELRQLYWQARFSELVTTETDRQQARHCLEDIARSLEPRP